jgi:Tfp pilus assembly protein PilF
MILRIFIACCLATAAWGQAASNSAKPAAPAASKTDESTDALASAQSLLKKGQFPEASVAFKAIVEKNPASADAQAGLVRSLLRARQLDEAEEAGKKAVAAVPSSALVHAALGDVDFRAGKFGDAETEYRTALKLDGNSARGKFGMARMFDMVSMHSSAKAAFAKAHELDPEDQQISADWLDSLPRAQRLEALKKNAGDHPSEREASRIKALTAIVQKKPWVLAGGVKPAEINMILVGSKWVGTSDINRNDGLTPYGKGYGVSVKFNDRASADLLLDSGADGIVIGNKLAEKIGVVKIADSFFGGIGDKGPVQGYAGWVDKIKIGNVEFHDCIVEVSSKSNVAEESGLIGTNVFGKFLITLDFRERKLLLAPLPKNPAAAPVSAEDDEVAQDRYIAPEMQSYAKVFILDDHLFIPVVVSDKAVGNFMLDTGADMNTMSPKLAALVTKASKDDEFTMKGVSGKVENVLTGRKAILQIAKIRIESHDLPVFATDGQSNGFGTEIAGFIGIRTLSQLKMTIDYRDGLVNLEVYEFKKARE